jgi:hypothetical protein
MKDKLQKLSLKEIEKFNELMIKEGVRMGRINL